MPIEAIDLTNPTTLKSQAEQLASGAQGVISSASQTVLSPLDTARGVIGGISGKLKEAGASVSGAATAAYAQLGAFAPSLTKFVDSLGTAEKIKDIRPEGKKGKVTEAADQLQFPLDLGHYYIKFTFKSAYQKSSVFPRTVLTKAVIFLPLPSELNERYSVQYAEKQLGMAGLLEESGLLKAAQDTLGGTMTKEKAQEAGRSLANIAGAPGNLAYLARSGIKSVSDTAGAAIDRVTGSILNPYQALQFQGIDLRSHSFRFRCSPNSEKEAEALKAIIQQFKIRMLPEKEGLLFNFPDICTIEFQTRNMPYSFKNCYLKSMGVNYAPQGTPSFFKGGKHPTEAEISLEFGEVEPVTRQDAEKGDFTMEAGTNSTNKGREPLPSTNPAPKPKSVLPTNRGRGGGVGLGENDQPENISNINAP